MSEGKDPAIKLFGKIIQRQWPPPNEEQRLGASGSEPSALSVHDVDSKHNCSSDQNRIRNDEKSASTEPADSKQDTVSSHTVISERKDATAAASSAITDNPNEDSSSPPSSKKEDQSETSTSQEKTALKKPDKIIPCPRCNSMDTKFCYFNNYNVNQPRHFCKNCQRYWTAGGTMRNVPVGAGRRRNKNATSNQHHHRHLLIPDGFQPARPDNVVGGMVHHHPTLRAANGTILAFGSDVPLCESMASALNLGEQSLNCMPNGFIRSDQHHGYQLSPRGLAINNGYSGDRSSGSCSSASIPAEKGGKESESAVKNLQGVPVRPQVPCFQEHPPSYPWNPTTQWSSNPAQQSQFLHPGIPVSFYSTTPPPYWGCGMPSGSWTWTSAPSISSDQSSTSCSSPNSHLGKHSRDVSQDNEAERKVLVPKTLRIDDPTEAAKSSIWATLGISKNDKINSIHGGGGRLFEGFQLAHDERNSDAAGKSLSLLEANPAAMSRSLTFQEIAK